MKKLIASSLFAANVLLSLAQPAASDTLRKDALNVFMSASDYIRKEIPYVNYVRDIRDADVYVISTTQQTGSGGTEFSYFLVGQKGNASMRDTLSFTAFPGETQEEIRIKQVRTLKMGLMRYVARTPLSRYMNITFTEPMSETVSTDKWKSWVFRSTFSGHLNGEQTYRSSNLFGDLSASKVTPDWKINLRGRISQSSQRFEMDDGILKTGTSSKSFSALAVKSLSGHWSVGGSATIGSASYRNEKLSMEIMPGIEYDIYPYSESTRRQLRLLYSIGYSNVSYYDTTIYNKIREVHLQHSLNIAYEVVQKWGTIEVDLDYSNYLHDWGMNNLSVYSYINVRIFKGLTVNFGGGGSLVHDQLGLVKGGASTEEILLRRKEIATSFDYFTSFGLTLTFGSIYNNVVNPRFGSIGGGGMYFY